jgi:hypothetical protein
MRRSTWTFLMLAAACSPDPRWEPLPLEPCLCAPPPPVTDVVEERFVQVPARDVDVLVVVDDGVSAEHHGPLTTGLTRLFDHLHSSDVDFHLGVTTMDMSLDGPGRGGLLVEALGERFVTPNTPAAADVFASMLELPEPSGAPAEARAAAWAALTERADEPQNVGFLREDADLRVIFVSDRDDLSQEPSSGAFIAGLQGLKWAPELVRIDAISAAFGESCAAGAGGTFAPYAQATGGSSSSVCDADWTPHLGDLGDRLTSLPTEFFLSRPPVPHELTVQVRRPSEIGEVTLNFQTCSANRPNASCDVRYSAKRNSVQLLRFEPLHGDVVLVRYGTVRTPGLAPGPSEPL